jgi:4-hydroxy-3-polyprenylbenzoate decarboxylase
MTTLAEAGATILPACPAWYTNPQTLDDLADTVVARVLQNLGIEQKVQSEWMID